MAETLPSPAAVPPACPGPDPAPRGPTRFRAPPGAVNTPAHVIGLPPASPFVERHSHTPPAATPDAYLAMLYGGGLGFDALDATEALCLEMGWHLQFLLDARTLPGSLGSRLSRLRVGVAAQNDVILEASKATSRIDKF